jgi:hypothetical protein
MATRRRIEAAEAVLGYEAPTDAVSRACEYLMSIFDNREEEIGNRMDALKLSRKFEAKKISPQTVHLTRREEVDRKEAWRAYEITQLQQKIILATLGHPPPVGTRICLVPTTCLPLEMSGLLRTVDLMGSSYCSGRKSEADRTKQTGRANMNETINFCLFGIKH